MSHTLSRNGRYDFESETFVTAPLTTRPYGDNASRETMIVAHTLRGEGHDASEDGTGRGLPIVASSASGLRRLTPAECERLQGLPDNWTAINAGQRRISPGMARYLTGHGLECWQDDGRWFTRVAADGPRYKAIGNGMAVPVIGHLLSSIRALSTEGIKNDDD